MTLNVLLIVAAATMGIVTSIPKDDPVEITHVEPVGAGVFGTGENWRAPQEAVKHNEQGALCIIPEVLSQGFSKILLFKGEAITVAPGDYRVTVEVISRGEGLPGAWVDGMYTVSEGRLPVVFLDAAAVHQGWYKSQFVGAGYVTSDQLAEGLAWGIRVAPMNDAGCAVWVDYSQVIVERVN